MTNEEAIKTLKANYPDACYEQLREAVIMAIEALEKQMPYWYNNGITSGWFVKCPNCGCVNVIK